MHNQSLLQQAQMFRECMGQPMGTNTITVLSLQETLIREEFLEFMDKANTNENKLKELADLVFVCYQYAAARGWDLDTAMRRIFESNMSKLVDGKPVRRSDGKVMKGPHYQPPDLSDLV
jgi:NTP pyrophosphatase (non-canonical NTP hydrolase)